MCLGLFISLFHTLDHSITLVLHVATYYTAWKVLIYFIIGKIIDIKTRVSRLRNKTKDRRSESEVKNELVKIDRTLHVIG